MIEYPAETPAPPLRSCALQIHWIAASRWRLESFGRRRQPSQSRARTAASDGCSDRNPARASLAVGRLWIYSFTVPIVTIHSTANRPVGAVADAWYSIAPRRRLATRAKEWLRPRVG